MRMTKFLAAMALVATPIAAQAPNPLAAYQAEGTAAGKPGATIFYGHDPMEVGDLRVPPGKGPFPVAMLIHGGCWLSAMDSRKSFSAIGEALTKRGIATWNIEYRRIGDSGGGWPGTFEDIAKAEDKLADLATLFPLDLKRVTIAGHSAGAHLALWAGSRSKLPAPWAAGRVHPVSVVAIDGPGALGPFVGLDAQVCGAPVIVPLMGGTPAARPKEYAIASPADHLPLGVKQLLVSGIFRPLMTPYGAAARQSGDTVLRLDPAGANHFNIVTPSTPIGGNVIDFIAKNAF